MKKRVYTLYRVSTIGQVEKDDIPMQKEACHEFAERQGWEIVKEFSEKGVSGFKKSAKDRDQLQLLQQAAAAGEFDVLLVFMQVSEDDETYQNPVDLLFEDLGKKKPKSFAVRQYKLYKLAAGDICSK